MKIKHVALLLIPLAILGLWNSSRLYIIYSKSDEIIDHQLPTLISDHHHHSVTHTNKPLRVSANDINPNSSMETRSDGAATTLNPIPTTAPTLKPVTKPPTQEPTVTPVSDTSSSPKVKRKPLFDISQEQGESFSACLKWMDDYRQLGEWLAYHYHVLPLRYLVFFRDPKSWTDPQPILDQWSDKIQFVYWTNNSDFMTTDQQRTIDHMSIDTKKHRRAQRYFYHACLENLWEKNRTWAILMDTDEYLVIDSVHVPNVSQRLLQPGAALDVIHKAQTKDPSVVTDQTPVKWFENCTVMARREYPAFESKREQVYANVPTGIDAYRFVTLRFRHRGQKLIGKSMVDVSTLNISKIVWKDVYSHNLFDSCSQGKNKGDLMYVAHYLGSMEAYQRPADRRNDWMNRTKKFLKLNAKSERNVGIGKGDDEVRPWIRGFVDDVGLKEAQHLLKDVGFPYNATTALQLLE